MPFGFQEDLGLAVVTDGEYRRLNFQDSFGESVSGYDAGQSESQILRAAGGRFEPLQRWEIPNQRRTKRHGGFAKTTGGRTVAFGSKYSLGGVSLCQQGGAQTGQSNSHRAGSHFSEVRLAEFDKRYIRAWTTSWPMSSRSRER